MPKVRALTISIAVAVWAGFWIAGSRVAGAGELAEPPVGVPGQEGDYLRAIHQRLHPGWVDGFIRVSPYKQLGPSTSLRETEVSFVIRWDGTVDNVDVKKSSGLPDFDAAAVNAVLSAAPFAPPVDVMADDGLFHLTWHFARNYRLCSSAEVAHVEYPLRETLPALASRGKMHEAVRRMSDELSRHGWTTDYLSPFARSWLARPNLSSELDARAAASLAFGGDRHQLHLLETDLALPQTAAVAATALHRLGGDVAALLTRLLAGEGPEAARRQAVLAALRATPAAATGCPPCVELLAAAVLDPRQPAAVRAELIAILATAVPAADRSEQVTQALALAARDSNSLVRGAGLLAQIPPGGSRVSLVRMAPLLHDPLPEIRAAAAAGVLRAGGDAGIEQLFLLARERDPRPLIGAATELGHMSSEASLQLLRKLLKRSEITVRGAVVLALASRRDQPARELVNPILSAARANPGEIPSIRELALGGASPAELVVMSTDARLGLSVYRALLRAQRKQEAAAWLLANVERLSPEDQISAFGDWLAEAPRAVNATAQQ